MPILSLFPSNSGSGGSGLVLEAVSGITTMTAHERVYVKWTDPDDLVADGSTLAAWGGTLLVRKAGSAPASRRDGAVVLDSKTRNAYKDTYFCDSGLTDGVQYFYKFFPYTTSNAYTNSEDDIFTAIPQAVAPGNVTGKAATASGNGKLTVKWTDPASTIVTDGVTRSTWASTKVVYKTGSYPTSPEDGTLAINSTTRNAYATNGFQITGLTNGTTYYIAFFPVSTEGAINTHAANRITGVPNRIAIANVPAQSGYLTYNENNQTPSWSNFNSTQLTIGGTTSSTNAGTYNATFTPKDDYCWSDGSTSDKTVPWTINKAAGSLSLSKSSITLNSATKSTTFTVTRAGDGAITVESSDTSVAAVSLNGTTVTVSSVNDKTGTATITVQVAAGTNHTAPANKTCSVSCQFLPAVGTALNDISWADIKRISDAGLASNYFAVGDRKAVTLNGIVGSLALNGTYYCYIIGIDHNSGKEGTNRIHFQFGYSALSGGTQLAFVDIGYGHNNTIDCFYMNDSAKTVGGWESSLMRTVICPAFKNAMPSDLKEVLKTVTKYSDNTGCTMGGGSSTASDVTATSDEVFLLAEFEVFGERRYANSAEQNYQAQYAWYSAGNSKVRYRHSATSSTAHWWLRSVSEGSAWGFCEAMTTEVTSAADADYSYGFAPAFCV